MRNRKKKEIKVLQSGMRRRQNVNKGDSLAPGAPNLGAYSFFFATCYIASQRQTGQSWGLEREHSKWHTTDGFITTDSPLPLGWVARYSDTQKLRDTHLIWMTVTSGALREKGVKLGRLRLNREWRVLQGALLVPFLRAVVSVRIARLIVILENYSWWVYIIIFVNNPATVYSPPRHLVLLKLAKTSYLLQCCLRHARLGLVSFFLCDY